jgi:Carboxypeptidase regulatory-like domain/TonB-dependent Receptor Plug Domain
MTLIARVFALSLAAFAVAHGQGNGLGSIRGTAVDPTGSIIPDVEITIVDLNRTTLTTRNGWFVLDSVPSGLHQVRARRAGFKFIALSLQVPVNDVTYADFVMKPLVMELAPVTVRSTAPDTRGAPPEFTERMANGQGTYFTAADIEKVHPHRVSDMLRRVPGLSVLPNGEIFSGRGVVSVKLNPCPYGMPVYVDRVQVGGGSGGDPGSILDDTLYRKPEWMSPMAASRSVVDGIKPQDIAGIEIYKGPATTPATLSGKTSPCGEILIWTR